MHQCSLCRISTLGNRIHSHSFAYQAVVTVGLSRLTEFSTSTSRTKHQAEIQPESSEENTRPSDHEAVCFTDSKTRVYIHVTRKFRSWNLFAIVAKQSALRMLLRKRQPSVTKQLATSTCANDHSLRLLGRFYDRLWPSNASKCNRFDSRLSSRLTLHFLAAFCLGNLTHQLGKCARTKSLSCFVVLAAFHSLFSPPFFGTLFLFFSSVCRRIKSPSDLTCTSKLGAFSPNLRNTKEWLQQKTRRSASMRWSDGIHRLFSTFLPRKLIPRASESPSEKLGRGFPRLAKLAEVITVEKQLEEMLIKMSLRKEKQWKQESRVRCNQTMQRKQTRFAGRKQRLKALSELPPKAIKNVRWQHVKKVRSRSSRISENHGAFFAHNCSRTRRGKLAQRQRRPVLYRTPGKRRKLIICDRRRHAAAASARRKLRFHPPIFRRSPLINRATHTHTQTARCVARCAACWVAVARIAASGAFLKRAVGYTSAHKQYITRWQLTHCGSRAAQYGFLVCAGIDCAKANTTRAWICCWWRVMQTSDVVRCAPRLFACQRRCCTDLRWQLAVAMT